MPQELYLQLLIYTLDYDGFSIEQTAVISHSADPFKQNSKSVESKKQMLG